MGDYHDPDKEKNTEKKKVCGTKAAHDVMEHIKPPPPQPPRSLSPLSSLVSKFIAENAVKTHNSIDDETERTKFIVSLRDALRSVRDGKRPLSFSSETDSLSSTEKVIDFLAETTGSTLLSMEDEHEREYFSDHLTSVLRQSFRHDSIVA